jgi:hypothetical protein
VGDQPVGHVAGKCSTWLGVEHCSACMHACKALLQPLLGVLASTCRVLRPLPADSNILLHAHSTTVHTVLQNRSCLLRVLLAFDTTAVSPLLQVTVAAAAAPCAVSHATALLSNAADTA